ncbi:MAG: GDYXXLXY domain-containing protein [bacterium]|nr:GDYXXLXY domain-containing protein [bacterium]MDD5755823.1 GDYXXLXY domain-containing protein [bacterium]
MSKKAITLVIAAAWLLIALAIIISRERILSTGQMIMLETIPVDPRDLLRGDYVILNYKISTIDRSRVSSEPGSYTYGQPVNVNLEPVGKFWQPKAVWIKNKPSGGVNIKGLVRSSQGLSFNIEYGIESYFVPEGKGAGIETALRRNVSGKVAVEVAVDNSGRAMINRVLIDDRPVKFD